MTKVKFTYRMDLTFDRPVKQHAFSILAFPQNLPEQQICGLSWRVSPDIPLSFTTDGFGNKVGAGFCEEEHRSFSFEMNGMAWINRKNRKPEPLHGMYRYPSALCEMNDEMGQFVKDCLVPEGASNREKSIRLMNGLQSVFTYQPGSTSVSTNAAEAFAQKSGVCQDYAHILIAMCREIGVPARYVAGMIAGEGATHAWVEIYENGMWMGLDPTHNCELTDSYLKLAHGRDGRDCRVNRGIFSGLSGQTQNIYVSLEEQ